MDTSPVMLIVGAEAIASLKVAVMVTTFEPVTILLASVSIMVTVGAVLSMVKKLFFENKRSPGLLNSAEIPLASL